MSPLPLTTKMTEKANLGESGGTVGPTGTVRAQMNPPDCSPSPPPTEVRLPPPPPSKRHGKPPLDGETLSRGLIWSACLLAVVGLVALTSAWMKPKSAVEAPQFDPTPVPSGLAIVEPGPSATIGIIPTSEPSATSSSTVAILKPFPSVSAESPSPKRTSQSKPAASSETEATGKPQKGTIVGNATKATKDIGRAVLDVGGEILGN